MARPAVAAAAGSLPYLDFCPPPLVLLAFRCKTDLQKKEKEGKRALGVKKKEWALDIKIGIPGKAKGRRKKKKESWNHTYKKKQGH